MTKRQHARQSYTLLAIMMSFIVPMIGAYLIYRYHDHLAFATTNVGTLIEPAIPMATLHLKDTNQQPLTPTSQQWRLAYFSTRPCDLVCQFNLQKLRGVHLSLGKNQAQVKPLFIIPERVSDDPLWRAARDRFSAVTTDTITLVGMNTPSPTGTSQFLLIDPQGYIMMRYSANIPGNGMLRDLRHLLQVARG